MPSLEPNHPPPSNESGAVVQPRQLNRWLDVNPQGGQLTRTHKYLSISAFTTTSVFNQYSQIVTSFNVEAPNNFSLKPYTVPANPNYVLCVSYRIGEVVTRYLLWDATGSNIAFYITPYTGQIILKNFRLEIWDTSQGSASQATELFLYTSVLGDKDYMYADDSILQNNDGQVTNFWNVAQTIPTLSDYGLILSRYLSTSGFTAATGWDSTDLVDSLASVTCLSETITARYQDFLAILAGANALVGTAQGTINYLFVAFQYTALTGANIEYDFITFDNSYQVKFGILAGNNYVTVNGVTLNNSNSLVNGDIYLLICVAGVQAFLMNVHTGAFTNATTIAVSIGISTALGVGGSAIQYPILDILPMFNVTNFQAVYNYYKYTYNGPFLLPLTMPANSISVTN